MTSYLTGTKPGWGLANHQSCPGLNDHNFLHRRQGCDHWPGWWTCSSGNKSLVSLEKTRVLVLARAQQCQGRSVGHVILTPTERHILALLSPSLRAAYGPKCWSARPYLHSTEHCPEIQNHNFRKCLFKDILGPEKRLFGFISYQILPCL